MVVAPRPTPQAFTGMTMSDERTPGEWFAGDSGTVYGDDGRKVVAYNIDNDADIDLIAAAPALLAALKNAIETHHSGSGRWLQTAYEAIAKAEPPNPPGKP